LLNTIDEYESGTLFLWGYDEKTGGERKQLAPDSPEWFTWLASLSSFCYKHGDKEHFTARREKQRKDGSGEEQPEQASAGYWYAYLKVRGRLFKRYLGKTDQLTLAYLRETAQALYGEALTHVPGDAKLDRRAMRRRQSVTESLIVGGLVFRWEDTILTVEGLGGREILGRFQAAELLSYLYDRRGSIL
jgi:hypothetical protein